MTRGPLWLYATYSHDDQPTKEASAARKRLLEAFGQYDVLSKRIRKIPCPGGKGSSQDRVQMAIASRANLFLQKNMFPLQVCFISKFYTDYPMLIILSSLYPSRSFRNLLPQMTAH